MQPSGTENHTFNYLDLVNYLAVGNLNPAPLGYVGGSDVFPTVNAGVAQGIAAAVNAFPRDAGRDVGDHARARRRPRHGRTGRHGLPVAPAVRAGAVVRRNRLSVGGDQLAGDRTSSGATVFGRRLCELLEANQSPARYFGPNLSRLSAVRQKYDPGRVMFSGLNY